ncbi:hypothetical protein GCM10025768_01510 [Microbacterium pseudoresistens]|uniref:4-oxalocrotonate tautomerase family enzyme n=1 Tax=Microbacterium pseudoresistens TaxID=640634 RepID=A0A7Y9EUF0_9MICO|nr:tautomerase family protein [Microbacterium pseudoresistens]NYD53986.1 4-oxalocrotonate tautomerase family enzyme [Microbacterium pseudoresistens]
MPRIIVQAKAGRTHEQKADLARSVTDAVVSSFGCTPASVTIVIEEIELTNFAKAGILDSDG